MSLIPQYPQDNAFKTGIWLVLLGAASFLTTFALACATPVAAFAALAALYMRRKQAMILLAMVWLAGQAVGFGFLHYPLGAGTLVWSAALLICAFFTLEVAMIVARQVEIRGPAVRAITVLAAAMIAFKIAIYLFGLVLGGNAGAFAPAVVFKFAWTNLASFIFLLVLHKIAMTVGLVARSGPFAIIA
jgi:hypothetical protein